MSEFSEYFKKCVNQCGKKRYQLAIESGVKEAMISRMKASDKDVSRLCKKPELMERLIRVMDLPEEQSIRLWKLYLQELKRCPGYEYLVANIQLLDQFRMMKQTENLPLSEGMDLQDQQILSGKRRIFEVCQELVLREAAREHGQIQMQVRTDWEEFNYSVDGWDTGEAISFPQRSYFYEFDSIADAPAESPVPDSHVLHENPVLLF